MPIIQGKEYKCNENQVIPPVHAKQIEEGTFSMEPSPTASLNQLAMCKLCPLNTIEALPRGRNLRENFFSCTGYQTNAGKVEATLTLQGISKLASIREVGQHISIEAPCRFNPATMLANPVKS